VDVDGTGLAHLTTDGARNQHPTWSPDGLRIAFGATHATGTDLYAMAANGSGSVRLTQGGFVGSPAWSPDGTRIAFDCRVDVGNDDICVVNADGTGFTRLTNDPARDYGAAWKPDGSLLAFATARYGADEIALVGGSGGSVSRLGAGLPGFEPAWSPDGTRLAFVRTNLTSDAIFVATADGANVHSLYTGDQPAWKPHQ
jgi:TolB protein